MALQLDSRQKRFTALSKKRCDITESVFNYVFLPYVHHPQKEIYKEKKNLGSPELESFDWFPFILVIGPQA